MFRGPWYVERGGVAISRYLPGIDFFIDELFSCFRLWFNPVLRSGDIWIVVRLMESD